MTPSQRRFPLGLLLLLGLLGRASVANAQVVQGTVREASQQPVAGVVITLLDSVNAPVARALTDTQGAYRMLTQRPGTYHLRAQRVGYLPTTVPVFTVETGAVSTQHITLEGSRVQLQAVRVVARSSCGSGTIEDPELFGIWDQAHTTLAASLLTAGTRGLSTSTLRIRRALDPRGRVLEQDLTVERGNFTAPWASQPIATLRSRGYVWSDRQNNLIYNAPGIDALVSPLFLSDHCFRLVAGSNASEIGVAFEPVPARRSLVELRGTFWVDRSSAELRRLEFQFTNAEAGVSRAVANSTAPIRYDPLAGGGTMSFVRLPSGAVLIERWELRMPILTREIFAGRTRTQLDMEETVGGMLLAIHRGTDTLFAQPRVAVRGTAVDSGSGRALPAARIRFLGTSYVAQAGADGQFVVPDVVPGMYTVAVSTAEHDSLGLEVGEPLVVRDSMAPVRMRVPTAYQLASTLCGTSFAAAARGARATRGALFGRVTATDDTLGLAGLEVVADWTVLVPDPEGVAAPSPESRRLSVKTSSSGHYRMCGVPLDVDLAVRVLATEGRAGAVPTRISHTHLIGAVPLSVNRALPATGMLVGTVVSAATGRPVADAEILVDGTDLQTRSDSAGVFRLTDVPAGAQRLTVRRLGYAVTTGAVHLVPNDVEDRRVVLNALTTLDAVDVTAERASMRLTEFEEHRRVGLGHFMDRAELARTEAMPLSSSLSMMPSLSLAAGRYVLSRRTPISLATSTDDCDPRRRRQGPIYAPDLREQKQGIICACYPQVYVNGVLMNGSNPSEPFDLQRIQTREIEGVEWYTSPAQLPAHFAKLNSPCGVLVLHLREQPGDDALGAAMQQLSPVIALQPPIPGAGLEPARPFQSTRF